MILFIHKYQFVYYLYAFIASSVIKSNEIECSKRDETLIFSYIVIKIVLNQIKISNFLMKSNRKIRSYNQSMHEMSRSCVFYTRRGCETAAPAVNAAA
jgi:hypothetical protein